MCTHTNEHWFCNLHCVVVDDLTYRTSREEGRNQDSRLKRFIRWDTFLVMWVTWFDQHGVSLTSTPRNLKQETCSILQPHSWMSRLGRWILDQVERMSMRLVLEAFSFRALLDIHVFAISRVQTRLEDKTTRRRMQQPSAGSTRTRSNNVI